MYLAFPSSHIQLTRTENTTMTRQVGYLAERKLIISISVKDDVNILEFCKFINVIQVWVVYVGVAPD
jgi:hypothetical protein